MALAEVRSRGGPADAVGCIAPEGLRDQNVVDVERPSVVRVEENVPNGVVFGIEGEEGVARVFQLEDSRAKSVRKRKWMLCRKLRLSFVCHRYSLWLQFGSLAWFIKTFQGLY